MSTPDRRFRDVDHVSQCILARNFVRLAIPKPPLCHIILNIKIKITNLRLHQVMKTSA